MAKTANISIRVEPELKAAVDGVYSRFGLTIGDAINIFLHKSLMAGGLPFNMTAKYNKETLAAIKETQDIMSGKIKAKSYSSLQEMIDEIEAEGLEEA